MDKHNFQRMLGLFCFAVGLLLSLALIGVSVWADLEASYYGFDRMYAENLTGLTCPVLMERGETGSMSVRVENPSDRDVVQIVVVRLSSPLTTLQARKTFHLAPGEAQRGVWEITEDNIDLRRFVFAHVIAFPISALPMREAMCGVFVVDLPGLTGDQIYYGLLVLALLGLALGLVLWDTSRIPATSRLPQVRAAMRFLVLVVVVGLASSALGLWMVGVVTLVVLVLMMVTILYLATTG